MSKKRNRPASQPAVSTGIPGATDAPTSAPEPAATDQPPVEPASDPPAVAADAAAPPPAPVDQAGDDQPPAAALAGTDAPPAPLATVRALVLLDCIYGRVNEVKEFEPSLAKAAAADGYIDTHPNAVAYGESLKAR
jgi:hypothetical protein